jgi:putative SOS response-associated peptidase YedK
MLEWGLIPAWVKDPSTGNRTITIRAEAAPEKRSFRTPFKRRRRLVLTAGFYEWPRTPDGKQLYYIRMKDGSPFAPADFGRSGEMERIDAPAPPSPPKLTSLWVRYTT